MPLYLRYSSVCPRNPSSYRTVQVIIIVITIILFATRITSNNMKHVNNYVAGCQKSIKTLIKLATYYITHNGVFRQVSHGRLALCTTGSNSRAAVSIAVQMETHESSTSCHHLQSGKELYWSEEQR